MTHCFVGKEHRIIAINNNRNKTRASVWTGKFRCKESLFCKVSRSLARMKNQDLNAWSTLTYRVWDTKAVTLTV